MCMIRNGENVHACTCKSEQLQGLAHRIYIRTSARASTWIRSFYRKTTFLTPERFELCGPIETKAKNAREVRKTAKDIAGSNAWKPVAKEQKKKPPGLKFEIDAQKSPGVQPQVFTAHQ